ncbi:MAG: hypothetical protein IJS74_00025 [Clostridia bacterium]|nr:hypothetical protein [Clostridia bacterium]
MKKKIKFELDVPDKIRKFVTAYAKTFEKEEDDCYKHIVELGFINGASDYQEALEHGYKLELEFLNDLPYLKHLQEIANSPMLPANEVEKELIPLVELGRDDQLAQKLIKEREQELKNK